jgi:hypothetical protein
MEGDFSEPVSSGRDEPFRVAESESAIREHGVVSPVVVSAEEQLQAMQMMDMSSSTRSADGEAWPVTPAPSASGVRVRAPKGLRPVRSGNAKQTIEESLEDLFRQTRTEHGRPLEVSERALQPTQGEAPQISQEVFDQVETAPLVPYPRPLITKAANPTHRAEAKRHESSNQVLPTTTVPGGEAKPQMQPPLTQMPVIDKEIKTPRTLEVRAIASRQATLPVVSSATDKRRRGQISIGRIDVQVNNQPAQQQVSPQSAKLPTRSNFLDSRYLSRFFLRP